MLHESCLPRSFTENPPAHSYLNCCVNLRSLQPQIITGTATVLHFQNQLFIRCCNLAEFLFRQKSAVAFSFFFSKRSKKIRIIFLIIQMMAVFSQFSNTVGEYSWEKKGFPGQSSGGFSFFFSNLQLFPYYPFLSLYFFT